MTWAFITGFGDASVLLPIALLLAIGIGARTRDGSLALGTLLPLGVAACVVALSKVMFLGFGWGIAALDFTGASGHAMLAFALYPLLAVLLAGSPGRAHGAWVIGACAFAALIAVSRVAIGVHSISEIGAGAALGLGAAIASVTILRRAGEVRLSPLWASPLVALLLVANSTAAVPAWPTPHGLISRLALAASGRAVVYTRLDLHLRKPA